MLSNLGPRIRIIRQQKGISLNSFAEKLGVSPGYLSNLETGKTDTIQLSIIDILNKELGIFPNEDLKENDDDNEFVFRLKRNMQLLNILHNNSPQETEYLIAVLEKGIDFFQKKG
ncbi:helix-turn-helix domain-containing protein [Anaerobacillus sp. 1_MG-2023]|uniref:helix-turn-helix domain-containing protein n=1 Tax=Anaerobacillus sp. 1_MG-2023 TaxID=3062655 RepID=UPI0026E18CA4|nr:helix-turn-helix transcriptional regulator [Anaerobacillus sp. 1_MG-2023]MDO6655928.1 helix-turn-helix transcriptional regulator [Anaerobacillus sp. 1_MG-2023]